jgi:hypothetical protein
MVHIITVTDEQQVISVTVSEPDPLSIDINYDINNNNYTPLTATTTELIDKTHVINTSNKLIGRSVYNTVTDHTVFASGASDVSVWNEADGTLAHTPV